MIPQPFPLILPALASLLAGWLKDDKLPDWANFTIIIVFFVASCALCILYGGSLSNNPGTDIALILTMCIAVYKAVFSVLGNAPSPVAMIARAHTEVESVFAAPVTPVAMRASAQPLREESPVQPKFTLPAKPPPESPPAPSGE